MLRPLTRSHGLVSQVHPVPQISWLGMWSSKWVYPAHWHRLLLDDPERLDVDGKNYPLVNKHSYGIHGHRHRGFCHRNWWFSIFLFSYQRVHTFRVTLAGRKGDQLRTGNLGNRDLWYMVMNCCCHKYIVIWVAVHCLTSWRWCHERKVFVVMTDVKIRTL